ncbi:MAG: hypothetical protein FWG65_01745 [Turicibacter sp.]|nr:hypothetical protein [Turicibacter sp.]
MKYFTNVEKEACLPVILKMLDLAQITRREGVLSLEAEAAEEDNLFLKTGIELITDGTDPAMVELVLQNLISANDYQGVELLSRKIMLCGVLQIQSGCNPRIMATILLSMLGEEYLSKTSYILELQEAMSESYIKFSQMLHKTRVLWEESAVFEERISKLFPHEIQKLINGRTFYSLELALAGGCSVGLVYKILNNMSQKRRNQLCEDILRLQATKEMVLRGQEGMLNSLDKLEKAGEIFSSLHSAQIGISYYYTKSTEKQT